MPRAPLSVRLARSWLLPALLLGAAPPGHGDVLLGAGLTQFHIASDHPAIPDVSPTGYQLELLQTLPEDGRHALLLSAGGSAAFDVNAVDTPDDPFYPPDRAEYGFFNLAYQFRFLEAAPATSPYLSLGWGFSSINWQHFVFDQSGFGTSLGAGAMLDLDAHWTLDLGVAQRRYDAGHMFFSYGDESLRPTRVTSLSITLLYRFAPAGR